MSKTVLPTYNFKFILLTALCTVFSFAVWANEGESDKSKKFNPGELIIHHISDSHEWHFATIGETHVSVPLPVIIYSPERGLTMFSSSAFEKKHGNNVSEPLPSDNDTASLEKVEADEAHGGHHALKVPCGALGTMRGTVI